MTIELTAQEIQFLEMLLKVERSTEWYSNTSLKIMEKLLDKLNMK